MHSLVRSTLLIIRDLEKLMRRLNVQQHANDCKKASIYNMLSTTDKDFKCFLKEHQNLNLRLVNVNIHHALITLVLISAKVQCS